MFNENAQKSSLSMSNVTQFLSEQVTNLGKSTVDFEQLREASRLEQAKKMPVLQAKYGDFNERFFRTVECADKELAECEKCHGTCQKSSSRWMIPVVHIEGETVYVNAKACQFASLNRANQGFRLAKIPLKYAGKTFTDYRVTDENKSAVAIAKWLVNEKPTKGAYFYGGVGTGKTYLAAIVAQNFIADGRQVIFGDVPSLLADIKSTFDGGESTSAFLDKLLTVDLLVLDDIGAEKITDWSASQIYLLINGRYNAGLPIIVTSNYDFDGLVKRYGSDIVAKRFTSRLKEMTAQAFFGTKDWRN